MYNQVRIAEIPIYGADEGSFNAAWEKHIQRGVDEWVRCGWDKEEAEKEWRRIEFPRTIWKYSQIVGFLTVDLTATDILFEIYAPVGEGYRYDQQKKQHIQCWHINGSHFRVDSCADNDAIREEIYKWIGIVSESHLKNRYVDLSLFDGISQYIDYLAIIDGLKG